MKKASFYHGWHDADLASHLQLQVIGGVSLATLMRRLRAVERTARKLAGSQY